MNNRQYRLLRFPGVWEAMAEDGHCDGLGGAEYRRVYQEYKEAGAPPFMTTFILDHANRHPVADQEKQGKSPITTDRR